MSSNKPSKIPVEVQHIMNMPIDQFKSYCDQLPNDEKLYNDYVWSQCYNAKELNGCDGEIRKLMLGILQTRFRERAISFWEKEDYPKKDSTKELESTTRELNELKDFVTKELSDLKSRVYKLERFQ